MKCALCGAEWDVGVQTSIHPTNENCPMSDMWAGDPEAINAAIEAAKVDTRKPEKCFRRKTCQKKVIVGWYSGLRASVEKDCCPCAAFEKEG